MESTRAMQEDFGLQDAIECAYKGMRKAAAADTVEKCMHSAYVWN